MEQNSDNVPMERPEKLSLDFVRKQCALTATPDEFEYFIYICRQYGLNPLTKEIYFIKYAGKPTIITSRDGYLKIANRNPAFDGMESDTVYQGDKLVRRADTSIEIQYGEAHLNFDNSKLMGAFANVYRKDRSKSTSCFVAFEDYVKDGNMWKQYPNAMILKVAEVMALKRAFEISGLVTKEEVSEE